MNFLTVSEDHKQSQQTIFNSLSQDMSTLKIEHEEMKKSLLDVKMKSGE